MFFWNSLAFSIIHRMLAIWSLVPLPFLNPACTSGSSWFTYCWSLTWRISEHYLASMWNECSCPVIWTFLALSFGTEMKTSLFHFCGHCWVFQICWHIECSTLTASSFRILHSSARIPSSPLVLFVVMLPKAHLTSYSRMSGLGVVIWVIKTFLYNSYVSLATFS